MELQGLPEGLPEHIRLIERYLSQEISEAEQAMLNTWLNESPAHQVFFERITDRQTLLDSLAGYYEAQAMAGEAKAELNTLIYGHAPTVKPLYNRLRYWAAAAAAVLVIVTGTYLWYHQKDTEVAAVQPKEQKAMDHDAAPGSYKARLTLADGSTIILDSATAGKLAQQGSTEVLNKGGGLTYAPGTSKPSETVYNTLTTAKGEIYSLQLSEGTKIWLNSASSVRYPVAFNGERNVEITGEAYFEVAHLPTNAPFKVTVNGMEVKVLGTHFNINGYSDQAKIRTTLLEGSVAVTPAGSTKALLLKPGQQAAVSGSTVQLIEHVDTEQAIAWKNGYFQFNEADLKTVMHEIERWYDVQIVYEGNVPQPVFSGKLSRNANASQVLRVLDQNGIHFRIEGKKIIVTP